MCSAVADTAAGKQVFCSGIWLRARAACVIDSKSQQLILITDAANGRHVRSQHALTSIETSQISRRHEESPSTSSMDGLWFCSNGMRRKSAPDQTAENVWAKTACARSPGSCCCCCVCCTTDRKLSCVKIQNKLHKRRRCYCH